MAKERCASILPLFCPWDLKFPPQLTARFDMEIISAIFQGEVITEGVGKFHVSGGKDGFRWRKMHGN
jgi:hypothetical protein